MALYDWNKNGKKDFGDDFIEYNIYKDVMGENEDEPSYTPSRNHNGISNFGAVLAVIGGLVLQSLIYTIFEIDVDSVPVFVIVILWFVFFCVSAYIIDKLGI